MPSPRTCLAAAAVWAAVLGAGPWAPAASACGDDCGRYGYARGYSAPPVYAYAAPVDPYAAPPVYAYSYFAPRPVFVRPYISGFYTTPVEIFRGPRWNYAAAYYNPRRIRGSCRRVAVCGGRGPRWRRAYVRGPIVRGWRRW
jgi:hypothetical protein